MFKKFIFRALVFIIILFATDRITGTIVSSLYINSDDLSYFKLRYSIDSTRQDIIILGSSRAQYHFNPEIIREETGFSAYNCGYDGQGLAFSYIQLAEITRRYHPRMVILEVSPEIINNREAKEKLKVLLPFYRRDTLIRNTLIRENPLDRIKLASSIYPYNSTIVNLVRALVDKRKISKDGFYPLKKQLDAATFNAAMDYPVYKEKFTRDKFEYFDKIALLCKNEGIPLFVVISPYFSVNVDLKKLNDQIVDHCKAFENITVENYSIFPETLNKPQLFQDNAHLNGTGADLFTSEVSKKISLYFSGTSVASQ